MLWLPPIESIMDIVNYVVVNLLEINTLKLNMMLCVSHIDRFYLLFLAKCPGPNISYILRTKTNSTIYTQKWGSNNRTMTWKTCENKLVFCSNCKAPIFLSKSTTDGQRWRIVILSNHESFYDPPAFRFIIQHPSKSPVQSQRIPLGYRF